jgi:hypothetical protein
MIGLGFKDVGDPNSTTTALYTTLTVNVHVLS